MIEIVVCRRSLWCMNDMDYDVQMRCVMIDYKVVSVDCIR
jgi:hypothetical protein